MIANATSNFLSKLIALLCPFSEYFRKAHMSKDRFSFVPYKNLLKDVEGTVLDLLRQFRYLLDAESTVEAPSLSLVGVNLEVVGLRRNFDADDYDKSEFRLEDITDRHVVQAIDVTSLKGEAGVQPMHSVSMSSENVPFEGPIVENLAALLRREKLRAGTGNLNRRIIIMKLVHASR